MECGTPDAKYQRSSYPYVVDEVPPLRVDGRDSRAAVEHIGPFRGFVPVQFAHAAGIEAHVHPGDIFGDAELACRHLPRSPAAHVDRRKRNAGWADAAATGGSSRLPFATEWPLSMVNRRHLAC